MAAGPFQFANEIADENKGFYPDDQMHMSLCSANLMKEYSLRLAAAVPNVVVDKQLCRGHKHRRVTQGMPVEVQEYLAENMAGHG